MKRKVYIFAFMLLGLLVGFLIHALFEIAIIVLLVRDFDKYGLGMNYDQWMFVHGVWSGLTFLGGLYLGFISGEKWWDYLYVKQKARKWLKHPLKKEF